MDKSNPKDFRILSLSGGGYLGLFTACLLTEIEAQVGEPLGRRFDLIAGTSVGGILALALAFEVPMQKIKDLFLEQGEEIFSSRALPSNTLSKLMDLTRSVLSPKYTGTALRAALTQEYGDKTLADALHPVVIPAVELRHSRTKIFKTPHAAKSLGDAQARVVDVAMATSAAPGSFPSVKMGEALYADGGLFAVAPDQVALHEAELFMEVKAANVRMLSIGTGTIGYQPPEGVKVNDGAVDWLSAGRLILTLISVQQQHIQAMMEDRLQDRYVHLDAPWPVHAGLGIDIATPDAAKTLERMARTTMRRADRQLLERLFLTPKED